MDMSHEAAKDAAFTIASRRRRVRGCRLVIHVAVSVTQGVSREEVVDSAGLPFCPLVFSPNKGHQYPRLTREAGSGGRACWIRMPAPPLRRSIGGQGQR